MMVETAQAVETEQIPETAMDLVRAGAALIRLENDVQMRVAVERPRDEAKILKDARHELELYPSTAEEAIYVKPVGKDEGGQMQYVEGLSIRAAENLANRWDNSSWGCQIIEGDEDGVTLNAVFLDMERNTRHVMPRKVSRFQKRRTGKVVKLTPDRFAMLVSAESSKLLREVILRSLPAGLKAEYEVRAREIIVERGAGKNGTPDRNTLARMLANLARHRVGREQVERHMGKPLHELTGDDLVTLRGLANAIQAGEINAQETFGASDEKRGKGPVPGAPRAEDAVQPDDPTIGDLQKRADQKPDTDPEKDPETGEAVPSEEELAARRGRDPGEEG